MTSTALRVNDVGLRYRHFKHRGGWVLRGINFHLQEGEVLGVVGRNGAGKSSLLRALAGITTPDAGKIERKGSLQAALLTLNMGFLPHLPCKENVVLSGMLLGATRTEMEDKFSSIMEFSQLDVSAEQKVGSFSNGMRARLALSTSLIAAPDIVLIDELLGVGDGEFRETSSRAIRDLITTHRSVVLITHNLQTLGELSDRVLWIDNGSQMALGESAEVLASYKASLRQNEGRK